MDFRALVGEYGRWTGWPGDFLQAFQKFNDKFNDLLTVESNNNFKTNVYFQIHFLFYLKKFKSEKIFESNVVFDENLIDIFEIIFLEIFIKNKNFKISKVFYLYKLLVRLIIKKWNILFLT